MKAVRFEQTQQNRLNFSKCLRFETAFQNKRAIDLSDQSHSKHSLFSPIEKVEACLCSELG